MLPSNPAEGGPLPAPSPTTDTPAAVAPAPASPALLLHVVGPKRQEPAQLSLWDAIVEVHGLSDPTGKPIWDYRQVFVRREPLAGNVVLPGTIMVRARVRSVDVRIGSPTALRFEPGAVDRVVTLLLDCPPEGWIVSGGAVTQSPRCRCTAGEIPLGDFDVQPNPGEWQRHFRAALMVPTGVPESFAVNSSGLAMVGQARLSWLAPSSPALPLGRYQVVIPRPSDPPGLVMELDRERLTVDFPAAGKAYMTAFSDFAKLLRPGAGVPAQGLHWAGLDLDLAGGIPSFLWAIEPQGDGGGDASIDLRLSRGVLRLQLADQRLGDPQVSPRSLATCDGDALIRGAGSAFAVLFHAERDVVVPVDATVVLPEPLPAVAAQIQGKLQRLDDPPRLLWRGGRSITATDLDTLNAYRSASTPGPLDGALAELIGELALAQPFSAAVTGTVPPDLLAEPDLKDALSLSAGTLRWVRPWMSPEQQIRLEALAADVQWDPSFRKAVGGLPAIVAASPRLVYSAKPLATGFAESIAWGRADLVYDALGVAESLRAQSGITTPDVFGVGAPEAGRLTPAEAIFDNLPSILWGSMPTDDGWAELPFLNITEDLYLRVLDLPQPDADPALITGAATFGTTAPELAPAEASEQKWDLTLLDADVVTARCAFSFSTAWGLNDFEARFWGPELMLNGWLWLANVSPSPENSVPDFSPWLTALTNVTLRSPRRREIFPCPFLVCFERGGFARTLRQLSPKANDPKRTYAYPLVAGWTFLYRDNDRPVGPGPAAQTVFDALMSNPIFPAGGLVAAGSPNPLNPLLWRRHPSLPAIQTLPLTQTRTPPNYPSPSRQLAPFALALHTTSGLTRPGTWRFDVSPAAGESGAAAWPLAVDPAPADPANAIVPAHDWAVEPVVGLAYLSLPGLAGYPALPSVSGVVANGFLPLGLWHGLPANDEIHALAELPSRPDEPAQDPLPNEITLTRTTYAAHWAKLAEQAYLAATDAEPALTKDSAAMLAARFLIEPYAWNLKSAALTGTPYPGQFVLDASSAASTGLTLAGDAALRGLDGWFRADSGTIVRFLPPPTSDAGATAAFQAAQGTTDAIAVVAGSMAAIGDGTSLRDQRGLVRFATTESPIGPPEGQDQNPARVLRTGVSLEIAPGTSLDRTLATCLAGKDLSLDEFGTWSFWFRDLPLQGKPGAATTYLRSDSGHPDWREDVNDPAALGRDYGFRAGYEWRLTDPKSQPLRIGLLACHPLTLEKVVLGADDRIQAVELIARLQLPLPGNPPNLVEQVDVSNAALLVFDRRSGGALRLEEIRIAATNTAPSIVPPELIWPLSGAIGSPRLRLVDRGPGDPGLVYKANSGTTPARLTIQKPTVDLPVLDAVWSPRLADTLEIKPAGGVSTLGRDFIPPDGSASSVVRVQVKLDDSPAAAHALNLRLSHRWGRKEAGIGLEVLQPIDLVGKTGDTPHAFLGDAATGLELAIPPGQEPTASLNDRAIALSWAGFVAPPKNLPQTLPGMPLASPILAAIPFGTTRDIVRGFASLTFESAPVQIQRPLLAGQVIPTPGQLAAILQPRLKIDAAALTLTWTGLSLNSSEEAALRSLAHDSTLGADFRLQVQTILAGLDAMTPGFATRSGFAEMILPCAWGESLQQRDPGTAPTATAVFGSSSGRVDMGYTIRFDTTVNPPGWRHELLLNGLIEVKGLVSWPILKAPEDQPDNLRFTFPPARPSGTALGHLRHTARILLNQLSVEDGKLQAGRKGEPLFVVADGFALEFLAVVEHRFVEVDLAAGAVTPGAPPPPKINGLSHERGWTVVQEVRLTTPGVFAAFLRELAGLRTPHLGFTSGLVPLPFADLGYQRAEILNELVKDLEALATDPVLSRSRLIVEASVPLCVNPDDWTQAAGSPTTAEEPFTALQYLPLGTQRGILTTLDDFSSGRTASSRWVYVGLPFLGRLQDPAADGTTALNLPAPGESRLRLDPILHLHAQALSGAGGTPLDILPTLLASWADNTAIVLDHEPFDVVPQQSWPRLDPATLEESWFRVLSPPPEPAPINETAGSVFASLPSDSPGRLGQAAALDGLFDPDRAFYPPRRPDNATPLSSPPPSPALPSSKNFVWRQGALFVLQRVIDVVNRDPHGFALTGKRLFQLDRLTTPPTSASKRRLPAVTLLPPPMSPHDGDPLTFPHPVSFAISPYLGLDYLDESVAADGSPPHAIFGELLGLDRSGSRMIVIATKLLVDTIKKDTAGKEIVVPPTQSDMMSWALETYRHLAADSPLAVLRRRDMFKPSGGQPGLILDYEFAVFRDTDRPVITKVPAQPVRSELDQIRFAEGQKNRAAPPAAALAVELAPPQTRNVQPLYRPEAQPWGFSGLRLEIDVAAGGVGMAGYDDARLWWQTCHHYVQFALPTPDGSSPPLGGAGMGRQVGRLPARFRARAIRGMLPSVPDMPLPDLTGIVTLGTTNGRALTLEKAADLTQATLPGSVRCTIIGGRAGAPFAFRPHLIVQDFPANGAAPTPSYNSGAVPIQHRALRPVPLPANHLITPSTASGRPLRQDVALDAWGSWFDLGKPGDPPPAAELRTVIASALPRDDAFLRPAPGATGLDVAWILPEVDGLAGLSPATSSLTLGLTPQADLDADRDLAGWTIGVALVHSGGRFDLGGKTLLSGDVLLPLPLSADASKSLGGLPHGEPVRLDVTVGAKAGTFTIQGHRQTLSLESRIRRSDGARLPLRPVYALFEDPDYSRSLATPTARGAKTLRRDQADGGSVLASLSADRREYNPATSMFFAFFTDDAATEAKTTGRLVLTRYFGRNLSQILTVADPMIAPPPASLPGDPPAVTLAGAQLYQLHVAGLVVPGDVLEFRLDQVSQTGPVVGLLGDAVVVRVNITDRPVTPPPQAGYGLLRSDAPDGAVSCARFAWSPSASRIELVNPDDLRTEVVRRRAVFRWADTIRPPVERSRYAIQKVTSAGSTRAGLGRFEPIAPPN